MNKNIDTIIKNIKASVADEYVDPLRSTKTGVEKSSGITRPTLSISMADREKLLKMVEEEAKKIFKSGNVSNVQQDTIKNAVKRTLDASLVEEE